MTRAPTPEERAALDAWREAAALARDRADQVAREWERMVAAIETGEIPQVMLAQLELGRACGDYADAKNAESRLCVSQTSAKIAELVRDQLAGRGLTPSRAAHALAHGVVCTDPTCAESPEVEQVVALLRAGPH